MVDVSLSSATHTMGTRSWELGLVVLLTPKSYLHLSSLLYSRQDDQCNQFNTPSLSQTNFNAELIVGRKPSISPPKYPVGSFSSSQPPTKVGSNFQRQASEIRNPDGVIVKKLRSLHGQSKS